MKFSATKERVLPTKGSIEMSRIIDSLENYVKWQIRPFQPSDQAATQALILTGLAERWGALDPTRNPDLHDIYASYVAQGSAFFVVEDAGRIIGAGGLVEEEPGVGRIVRVSVSSGQRGRGIGRAISQHLIAEGRRRGCRTLLVETNDDWHSALQLYRSCGFVPYAHQNGEVHMKLQINE